MNASFDSTRTARPDRVATPTGDDTAARRLRPVTFLAALLLATGLAAAGTTTVIVEMDGEPAAIHKAQLEIQGQTVSADALQAYRGQLVSTQDAILAAIAANGIEHQVFTTQVPGLDGLPAGSIAHRWTLVLNGVAITIDEDDVPALAGVEGVRRVYPARNLNPQLDQSVDYIRASELYGGIAELTQFDTVGEGYEGQGMIISVIDTGIEWQHEMFGGDPTPPRLGLAPSSALVPENQKVIYYLPFSDLAVEDGFGHGTHVASTAAGYLGWSAGADNLPLTDDDVPVHGVAPQARLMAYGVCSDVVSTPGSLLGVGVGGCLNVFTITALEDSVSPRTVTGFAKPVAHVINLSLGGEFGTPDDATAVAASNAAAMGAIVVAAAGNSGSTPGIIGSPSTGLRVISVANATDVGSGAEWFVDVLSASAFGSEVGGAQTPASQFELEAGQPSDVVVYPMAGTPAPPEASLAQYYVLVANGTTAANYPASVSGRIALIDVGGAAGAFAEIANNAYLAGAEAALLIGTTENATAVTAPIPAAVIKPEDAQPLIDLLGPSPADGDVSPLPLRIDPEPAVFRTALNGSTSHGPVAGYGQVKPDLAAPGTNILAAVPPASVIGAVTATENGPSYGAISGTSMASPHVAGAAALIKQANPTWGPDEVRTALINTATPMRDAQNVPDSYGSHNPIVHGQGGGYVDVAAAAGASALMGVRGDGIASPRLLGSHAFGNRPLIGTQCISETTVEVEIADTRGEGGTWTLSVHDNRNASRPGIAPTLSAETVTVPPGGSATFEAGLSFDGSLIEDESAIEVLWFVVAQKAGGSESLSMPMFLRAIPSAPAIGGEPVAVTETHTGHLGPGSTDAAAGESHVDIPVEVPAGTTRLQGDLTADLPTAAAYPDFDLELYDPSGAQLDSSGNLGSIENVDVEVSAAGTYTFRVINYLNVDTDFTLTVTSHQVDSGAPAGVAGIEGEYTDQSGQAIDFDGAYTVEWTGGGGELAYQLEQSTDGGEWEIVGVMDGETTSVSLADQADGAYSYRVRSHFPGVVCTYVAPPGAVATIVVDHREAVTATGSVRPTIVRGSANDGIWEFDIRLDNQGSEEYLAPVAFSIVSISSADVTVINADDGGAGHAASPAGFDYSARLVDERLAPGESSETRNVQFSNAGGQLFTFEAEVMAYRKPVNGSTVPAASPARGPANSGQPQEVGHAQAGGFSSGGS